MELQSKQQRAGEGSRLWLSRLTVIVAIAILCPLARGADSAAITQFHKVIQPILQEYCYECHGDGAKNGNIAFDELTSDQEILNHDLWFKVLKNTRAGIMPPPKDHPRLPADKQAILDHWIELSAFGVDPLNFDPGRITIRRLNRNEYRNTIRDLMGIDYDTDNAFPADDVGYGFDTIGEVQSLSPMRMEKFFEAAQFIVSKAVPTVTRALTVQFATGKEFLTADGKQNGDPMNFYEKRTVSHKFNARVAGDYRIEFYVMVDGTNRPDPQRCNVSMKADGKEFFKNQYIWFDCEFYTHVIPVKWDAGDHDITVSIEPVDTTLVQYQKMDYKILTATVYGPLDEKDWINPPGYDRFFTRDTPPQDTAERRSYAREVLTRFATKAFRRPVSSEAIDELVNIAEKTYSTPGNTFETGVSRAMVAVLASPRFLFRVESAQPDHPDDPFADIDEYALASRLSYLLWSSMPDDELLKLAAEGKLRQNLESQVKRMFADPRAKAFVENFTGQWLQSREILGASLNRPAVMAREGITTKEDVTTAQREAMKMEPEAYFGYVASENRSVLELLSSNYTFLNDTLAKYYGIAGVTGPQMRQVMLPPNDPRGGVLTMASVLAVTSDPARTSPVKRGKWILENILGAPSPPPPPDVPTLEETLKKFQDHVPTQREALAAHRANPMCASCHNRMDPLGLALENFNALGLFRTKEQGQAIDASGQLLSGESFKDAGDLKQILATSHRTEFYRTLTEKLLTYAVGRGLEYYDVPTVDQIVGRLEQDDGHFSDLLLGVIESAPFQKRRVNVSSNVSSDVSSNASSMVTGATPPAMTPQPGKSHE